jgi:selenocysteine-specific elongation factor
VAFIDRMEAVKSVGNVAQGLLRGGTLKVADKLFVLPEKKEIEVRSLQVNGKDVEQVSAGERFSMAYRGEPFERGILVPLRHEFEIGNIVNGHFSKTPFYKDELKGKIHAYSGLQFVEGHMSENDLTLSEPIAYEKGEIMLVVDASNQKLRIAGPFQSKW